MGYVLAVRTNHTVTTGSGRTATAAAATGLIPARAWHRMRTGSGTKGTRHYDWAMLEVTSDDTPAGHGEGHSVTGGAVTSTAPAKPTDAGTPMPRQHRDRTNFSRGIKDQCWVVTFPERCGPTVDAVGQAQSAPGRAPMATKVSGRQFALVSPATAVILGALALVLLIASLPLSSLSHQLTFNDTSGGVGFTLFFGGVGVVVARRQPRNPIGWLLTGVVVLVGLSVDAGYYALLRYRLGHPGLPLAPVAVLLTPLWAAAIALLPPVILLFPDGRLTSRLWRWMLWIYAGLVACVLAVLCAPAIAAVAGQDIHVDSSGDVRSARHLAGWLAHPPQWLATVVLVSIVVIALSCVARQVLSWRRATGERRQQLKWLAFGAAVTIGLGLLAANFTSGIVSEILSAGTAALPVSIGIGILKYRLYDIDRIISRTLAYAIVTGLLLGLYAGLVLLATRILSFHTPVAVAASTLAAAALFNPLRHRVQHAVDRRFNRARYDADQTVAAFAARLKDAVDLGSVRDDLAQVVSRALEPAHLSVWISHRD